MHRTRQEAVIISAAQSQPSTACIKRCTGDDDDIDLLGQNPRPTCRIRRRYIKCTVAPSCRAP